MWKTCLLAALGVVLTLTLGSLRATAVELRVSRQALERTLRQQLFGGPGGRYYLKGSTESACFVYVEDPQVSFKDGRIVVRMKTHARVGKHMGGTCLGISLSPESEVSLAPDGEEETVGFHDARLEHVSEQRELNFLLKRFLSHTVPTHMKVNAAELLRKALEGSTASSGYTVTVDQLKIVSVQIDGDDLVVEADGGLSVK